jgi:hypothetical protein
MAGDADRRGKSEGIDGFGIDEREDRMSSVKIQNQELVLLEWKGCGEGGGRGGIVFDFVLHCVFDQRGPCERLPG